MNDASALWAQLHHHGAAIHGPSDSYPADAGILKAGLGYIRAETTSRDTRFPDAAQPSTHGGGSARFIPIWQHGWSRRGRPFRRAGAVARRRSIGRSELAPATAHPD
jgi:hypothetical protein